MPTYSTVIVTNLTNGLPFNFEVSPESLNRFEYQKKLIKDGKASPMLGTLEKLTRAFEFSLFPTFKQLLNIFFEDGFSDELLTQILQEFGIEDKSFIHKLLEDEDYISRVKPWFEGITHDGERAARTLMIVYDETKRFYSIAA
jgi:hypothetical protein